MDICFNTHLNTFLHAPGPLRWCKAFASKGQGTKLHFDWLRGKGPENCVKIWQEIWYLRPKGQKNKGTMITIMCGISFHCLLGWRMYFDIGLIEIKKKKNSINSRSTTRFGWVYIGFNFLTFSIFLSEGGGGGNTTSLLHALEIGVTSKRLRGRVGRFQPLCDLQYSLCHAFGTTKTLITLERRAGGHGIELLDSHLGLNSH